MGGRLQLQVNLKSSRGSCSSEFTKVAIDRGDFSPDWRSYFCTTLLRKHRANPVTEVAGKPAPVPACGHSPGGGYQGGPAYRDPVGRDRPGHEYATGRACPDDRRLGAILPIVGARPGSAHHPTHEDQAGPVELHRLRLPVDGELCVVQSGRRTCRGVGQVQQARRWRHRKLAIGEVSADGPFGRWSTRLNR